MSRSIPSDTTIATIDKRVKPQIHRPSGEQKNLAESALCTDCAFSAALAHVKPNAIAPGGVDAFWKQVCTVWGTDWEQNTVEQRETLGNTIT
jgi:hypothetical protein